MFKKIKMSSYTCDHIITLSNGSRRKCGQTRMILSSREEALKEEGWMVTRDKRCYCPECAPFYRHVGRGGKPREHIQIIMEGIDGRK